MNQIQIGDIVTRKSYESDIFFRVTSIEEGKDEKIVTIKGIHERIQADAPISDLILQKSRVKGVASRLVGNM